MEKRVSGHGRGSRFPRAPRGARRLGTVRTIGHFRAGWLLLALFVMPIAACDSGVDPTPGGRLSNVRIAPQDPQVEVESTLQLQVTLADSDGDPLEGRTVFWSSEDVSIAEVNQSGLVTGKAVGSTRIAASAEGVNALTTIRVVPLGVTSVAVSPSTAELVVGASTNLQAIARDRHGDVVQGRPVSWSSDKADVAVVNAAGTVTGVGEGSATVTASIDGQTGRATITVSSVAVASVSISPSAATLTIGASQQFNATAKGASGQTIEGRPVSWTSSNSNVASVTAGGLVEARGPGAARITATIEGKSADAQVSVVPVAVASVELAPKNADLTVGGARTFAVTTFDSQGSVLTGRQVTWSTSNPAVASVSGSGVATALSPGTATITAAVEGKVAEAAITVSAIPVASVTISPTSASLTVGGTRQFTATPRDASGNALSGRQITWSSSNAAVVSVSGSGLATALSAGTAEITATVEGRTAKADVTVANVPVASIAVTPSSAEIQVLASRQFTATLKAADGSVLTGRNITWSSDRPLTAKVDSTGLVTGLLVGSATITASSEGKSATANVTVVAASTGGRSILIISGNNQTGANNERLSHLLVVRVVDEGGQPISGAEVVWTTNNGTVSPTTVRTDSNGYASTSWTLGGGGLTLTRLAWAEVSGLPRVEFRAYRE